jgi:hypothetical protein
MPYALHAIASPAHPAVVVDTQSGKTLQLLVPIMAPFVDSLVFQRGS